jgi:hypothetical protein
MNRLCALAVLCAGCPSLSLFASYRIMLSQKDVTVETAVLTATVDATFSGGNLFVQSDGNFQPLDFDHPAAAHVFIRVDGMQVSNDSYIDWSHSNRPAAHVFNAIGLPGLASGSHLVEVVAVPDGGPVHVSSANLTMIQNPAPIMDEQVLDPDSSTIDVTTIGLGHAGDTPPTPPFTNYPPLPHFPLLVSGPKNLAHLPVVALASGRSYYAGTASTLCKIPNRCGDPMWGIYADPLTPTSCATISPLNPTALCDDHDNTASTWTINDLFESAELFQAPMYSHAFFPSGAAGLAGGQHSISLGVTEYPWIAGQNGGEDPVQYRVGAGARLVVLAGMQIAGIGKKVSTRMTYANDVNSVVEIGANLVGHDVEIASGTLTIPTGRQGVIFFTGKARVYPPGKQAGTGELSSGDGLAKLWITLDRASSPPENVAVSPPGIQQLRQGTESQRTMSTSMMLSEGVALAAGDYRVHLWAKAEGVFPPYSNGEQTHVAMTDEAALVWFGRLQ